MVITYKFLEKKIITSLDESIGGSNLIEDVERNIEEILEQKKAILQQLPFV